MCDDRRVLRRHRGCVGYHNNNNELDAAAPAPGPRIRPRQTWAICQTAPAGPLRRVGAAVACGSHESAPLRGPCAVAARNRERTRSIGRKRRSVTARRPRGLFRPPDGSRFFGGSKIGDGVCTTCARAKPSRSVARRRSRATEVQHSIAVAASTALVQIKHKRQHIQETTHRSETHSRSHAVRRGPRSRKARRRRREGASGGSRAARRVDVRGRAPDAHGRRVLIKSGRPRPPARPGQTAARIRGGHVREGVDVVARPERRARGRVELGALRGLGRPVLPLVPPHPHLARGPRGRGSTSIPGLARKKTATQRRGATWIVGRRVAAPPRLGPG